MSVKDWNCCYKENTKTSEFGKLVDFLSLCIALGLVWCAFFQIMGERFSLYTEADFVILVIYLLLLWVPVSGILDRFGEGYKLVAALCGVAYPLCYLLVHFKKMETGIYVLGNEYLKHFNPYQGTNLSLPDGDEENAVYVVTLTYMIIWMFLWGLANAVKRYILLVLLPILAMFLQFMVGYSPTEGPICMIFVAAFLLLLPKGTGLIRQAVVIGVAVISIWASSVMFADKIDELSVGKEVIDRWLASLEFPQLSISGFQQIDFMVNKENVGNHKPLYSGKVMFEISMSHKPNSTQYFKGFCANEYRNGKWTWKLDAYRAACQEKGYSEAEIAEILARNMNYILSYSGDNDVYSATMELQYKDIIGDTAYVPYNYNSMTLDEDYTYIGDYLLKKQLTDKLVTVDVSTAGDLRDLSVYTHYSYFGSFYNTMLWYNDVAQKCANRPDAVDGIREAAIYIKEVVKRPTEGDLFTNSGKIKYDVRCRDTLLENMYRMSLAESVRQYLAKEMDYSLELDTLSTRQDPVGYALTEGKKGYCMHYASAAVLILKEVGVPARYASGYIVRPTDYVRDAVSDKYVASVQDYNSHAWAEIYLDNIGWVPIEVTEGYEAYSQQLPTQGNNGKDTEESTIATDTENSESENTETEEPTDTEEPETEEDTDTENASDTEEPDDTEEDSESEHLGSEDDTGAGTVDNSHAIEELWRKLWTGACIIISVLLVACGIKGLMFAYDYVLKKEIQENHTNKAVKMLHRRVVRKIRYTNINAGQLTDDRIEELLKKNYPQVEQEDWIRYMDITRKMHYSCEKLSYEEMMHCYRCYKNI